MTICLARGGAKCVVASSTGSGLEAFSRYPTHGSVAALACRRTAHANYANERFLSY